MSADIERVELSDEEEDLPDAARDRLECRREMFIEKNKYGRDDYSVRLEYDKARAIFVLDPSGARG